jgi:hypothetical protein
MSPPFDRPHPSESQLAGQAWLDSFDATLAGLTPEEHAAMGRVEAARVVYGLDFERELADLEAGSHPVQRSQG